MQEIYRLTGQDLERHFTTQLGIIYRLDLAHASFAGQAGGLEVGEA